MEKEMATHSNILAGRTPGTEKTGKLQSMGLQRVRDDLAAQQWQNWVKESKAATFLKSKAKQTNKQTNKPAHNDPQWKQVEGHEMKSEFKFLNQKNRTAK